MSIPDGMVWSNGHRAATQSFAEQGVDVGEIGWTGLDTTNAQRPREMNGPVWPADLEGAVWRNTLTLMARRDAVIHGVLLAIDTLIRQVKWEVRANEDAPDEELRRFVEECFGDLTTSWEDTLSEILSFLVYGFSFHEIVYRRRLFVDPTDPEGEGSKYNDGRDGWRKFPVRAQNSLDHWEFDRAGGLAAFVQTQPNYSTKPIPIKRGLLFRTRSRLGNPEGPSLLEGAHEQWRFKWHIQRMEAIGIERSLNGVAVAWGPEEMWDPDHPQAANYQRLYTTLKAMVTGHKQNESSGIVMPLKYGPLEEGSAGKKIYDLTIISTPPGATVDTDRVVTRYDQRMLTSILSAWLIMGQDKVGSFALADSMTSVFAAALGSFLDHIASVFNTYAIPRLLQRNGMDKRRAPRLWHSDIESVDLEKVGPYVEHLAKVGVTFSPTQKEFLTRQGGIPDATDEEKAAIAAQEQLVAEQQRLAADAAAAGLAAASKGAQPAKAPAAAAPAKQAA